MLEKISPLKALRDSKTNSMSNEHFMDSQYQKSEGCSTVIHTKLGEQNQDYIIHYQEIKQQPH